MDNKNYWKDILYNIDLLYMEKNQWPDILLWKDDTNQFINLAKARRYLLVSSFHRGGRHGDHLRFPGSRCQRISRKNLTARPVAMEVHPVSIR